MRCHMLGSLAAFDALLLPEERRSQNGCELSLVTKHRNIDTVEQ